MHTVKKKNEKKDISYSLFENFWRSVIILEYMYRFIINRLDTDIDVHGWCENIKTDIWRAN